MLGVHGNGLTHLVLMNPNRYSSVVEIFYPGGFAHDYEWTTRALGMRHFSVWNDTYVVILSPMVKIDQYRKIFHLSERATFTILS